MTTTASNGSESESIAVKLVPEEIAGLNNLHAKWNQLIVQQGELVYQERELERDKRVIDAEWDQFEQVRVELMKSLQDKYGVGQIDLGKGEFIPLA